MTFALRLVEMAQHIGPQVHVLLINLDHRLARLVEVWQELQGHLPKSNENLIFGVSKTYRYSTTGHITSCSFHFLELTFEATEERRIASWHIDE